MSGFADDPRQVLQIRQHRTDAIARALPVTLAVCTVSNILFRCDPAQPRHAVVANCAQHVYCLA